MINQCYFGDCLESMDKIKQEGITVQSCVTSPPYFNLRHYMPDAVVIREGLTEEEYSYVISELNKLGL